MPDWKKWFVKNGWATVGAAWDKPTGIGISIDLPEQVPTKDGKTSLFMSPNKFKQEERQPDYRVSVKIDDNHPAAIFWQKEMAEKARRKKVTKKVRFELD